jgi:hypothetical protein
MTKEQALDKTIRRFTNLLDGKVVSNISVSSVIKYYEALLDNQPTPVITRSSGILDNFIEEDIKEYEEDEYFGI